MKRNDIVSYNKDSFFAPFGRIVRTIDDEHVEVLDCGRFSRILAKKNLTHHKDYKGRVIQGRFQYMPTLRKLKAMCRESIEFQKNNK